MRKWWTALFFSGLVPACRGQDTVKSFIAPAAMIAYGVVAVHSGSLREVNGDVKEQIWDDNPHRAFHLDNYLQFGPMVAVYALNAAGVRGRNNFMDRSIILILTNIFANGVVEPVKV